MLLERGEPARIGTGIIRCSRSLMHTLLLIARPH